MTKVITTRKIEYENEIKKEEEELFKRVKIWAVWSNLTWEGIYYVDREFKLKKVHREDPFSGIHHHRIGRANEFIHLHSRTFLEGGETPTILVLVFSDFPSFFFSFLEMRKNEYDTA